MKCEQVAADERKRSPLFLRAVAAIPIVLVIAAAVFAFRGLGSETQIASVSVSASGPQFSTSADLAMAADVIVEGRIVGSDEGRVITDPANPEAGFSTRFFQLDVISEFGSSVGGQLIIEQESALLDGSPMVVNGLSQNQVGDVGFWFLVAGNDEEFPYLALVNEQGRMLYDDVEKVVDFFGSEVSAQAVREHLDGLTADR